jgi:2-haloacid dehalogenase
MSTHLTPKALAFDVFGTVVDWRTSLTREGELLQAATSLQADWPAFADAWRAGYVPAMDRTRASGAAWANIDELHRGILEEIIPRFGLQALTEAQRVQLNLAWHRLLPWPDTVAGMHQLKRRFPLASLSNGNVSLLVNMARHAGLPWDAVLSGELVQRYKPDPAVYLMAARLLGVAPGELMMVAAHTSDLDAARASGLMTAYVHRPTEFGLHRLKKDVPQGAYDVVASDFLDLARRLGA